MNEEKIKCLLLINESKKITVTALAKKMNVSKATMSRMVSSFYEEGYTLEQGKCLLSKRGKNYIEETKRKIKNLTYWLQKTSRLNEEEAHQEAIKLFTKEERLIQTSLTVKLKVDLLKGHMPENLALLKILFH